MSYWKVLLPALALLAGCSEQLIIDDRYHARSQDSRVQYIVLHYTSSGFERSFKVLTEQDVSSHYLISDHDPVIYRLVDENRRAWHAGDSSWQGRTWLNASSIGIEMVNEGYVDQPDCRRWQAWDQRQIDALILLLRDIQQRNDLGPDAVIGHSDIAPQRKVDPGPLFPWQQLVDAGVASGPDTQRVHVMHNWLDGRVPAVSWFQGALAEYGYQVPQHGELDGATRNVLAAFQMRFRQSDYSGQPDSETASLLAALAPEQASALISAPAPRWYTPAENPSVPPSGARLPPCTAHPPAG
ncbi:N-acetylmuramoyl-L-alanine amidase [Halopseudomonas sp.]|uniref:N-acetylmuramoyl-L-alanine amidase n=1 Tax=Halopseudomonas sp. TaxID=2901191 RepID=UPI00300279BC